MTMTTSARVSVLAGVAGTTTRVTETGLSVSDGRQGMLSVQLLRTVLARAVLADVRLACAARGDAGC